MPEGPSLYILREKVLHFKDKKVIEAKGYAPIDMARMDGQPIVDIRSWGKQLLFCFKGFAVRVHMMLFGSYRIDDHAKVNPSLSLRFENGEVNFYVSSIKYIEGDLNDTYDWRADIMADEWSARHAFSVLREKPTMLACDALMDQKIFSGSGNIIKNEVLYRSRIHPESRISKIPDTKLRGMIRETHKYAFDFLRWKEAGTLSKNWKAYEQKTCKRCDLPMKVKDTGKSRRRTYFCTNCQIKY
ncbi:MAG: glycosylase/AP lyase, DNA-binding [Bacteroidetes bacterium]|nr:glycosylase/AP lyase, DNA-binding [Bacteroidota bacterium]